MQELDTRCSRGLNVVLPNDSGPILAGARQLSLLWIKPRVAHSANEHGVLLLLILGGM